MAYLVYLGETLFPITPEEITMQINNRNETMDLINGGQVNRISKAGLTDIQFEVLLPYTQYPFCVGEHHPPEYYLEKLEKIKSQGQIVQFIVLRTDMQNRIMWDTNITVSLEEYEITESADDVFDVRVDIKLKQYIRYGTKKVTILDDGSVIVNEDNRGTPIIPTVYTVIEGDTLWRICKTILGDETRVTEIAKLNGIEDPNVLEVGQVIKLA